MCDADGFYTFHDLVVPIESAMKMAESVDLPVARKVFGDTIARGRRMANACGDPRMVLGVFPEMLPSAQGAS